jgi:uncharacterized membrane protein
MKKSAAFGLVHLVIAFGVTWMLTGSVGIAGAVTLVEPLCNTVAHFFFDRWWHRRAEGRRHAAAPVPTLSLAPGGALARGFAPRPGAAGAGPVAA